MPQRKRPRTGAESKAAGKGRRGQALAPGAALARTWREQDAFFEGLACKGAARCFGAVRGLENAFAPCPAIAQCVDEGCRGPHRLAGAGVLAGVARAARILRPLGVEAVASHAGCGAAALALERRHERKPSPEETDRFARAFARALARELGVRHLHIPASRMRRPAAFHPARMVFYDGTGSLNASALQGVPPAFQVNRAILPPAHAQQELALCAGIATGAHGMGARFTRDKPFYIVAVARDAASLQRLKREAGEVARAFAGRVAVDGFLAPTGAKKTRKKGRAAS